MLLAIKVLFLDFEQCDIKFVTILVKGHSMECILNVVRQRIVFDREPVQEQRVSKQTWRECVSILESTLLHDKPRWIEPTVSKTPKHEMGGFGRCCAVSRYAIACSLRVGSRLWSNGAPARLIRRVISR